jgi:DNA polymerase-3 subunit delta'
MSKEAKLELPHPRENAVMIGHAAIQERFIREFGQGLTHHAYLMTGAKGIGKATLAYRFARYVLSQGAQEKTVEEAPSMSLFGDALPAVEAPPVQISSLDMDADSSLFRRIAAGSHTDLLTISPAYDAKKHVEKNIITVDEARKVPEFLSLTPAEGLWRVVIVDAVDQLNDNAANALLKILEEPPPRAMLFLVCHQPAAILPTIRSRCRSLALRAPDMRAFGEILHRFATGIANHDYAALYGLSYGSAGHAMTLFQEDGLKWYADWLKAMQPNATAEVRQRFADAAHAAKSPRSWDAIIHCWHVAMQRISLFPHYDAAAPICQKEQERLATIAAATNPARCHAWVEEGRRLIHQTETFHLDKRQTIRLLADAAQLDMAAIVT